jgi:hypothetical protein
MTTFKSIATGLYLAVASIAVNAGPAHTVLLSANDAVFGIGGIRKDTDSGLEWLDVNLSVGRTFSDFAG